MADRRWLARLRQGPGRRVVLLGVAATILFQLSVLATQYLRSVWPLWHWLTESCSVSWLSGS